MAVLDKNRIDVVLLSILVCLPPKAKGVFNEVLDTKGFDILTIGGFDTNIVAWFALLKSKRHVVEFGGIA